MVLRPRQDRLTTSTAANHPRQQTTAAAFFPIFGAVAFGSGEVSIKQMVRAGVWLNVIPLGLVLLVMYTLVPLVFGVSL